MNLDLDLSAVPRFFRGALTDLRQKRLWPVAAALVVALVAVPVLLASSSSPSPIPQPRAQVPTPPPAAGASIPALSVQSTPSQSRLVGSSHDPFAGAATGTAASPAVRTASTVPSTAISTATASPTNTLTGGASSSLTGSSTASSTPSTGLASTPPVNPPSSQGSPKPKPTGLQSTEAYDVAFAITNSSGGTNTVDPLERLSVISSDQQPLLVELGVAQDGKHVLFAVQPGAAPSGPGTCTPGPVDCEILTLRQGQTEQLSQQTGSLGPSQVALFAVTSITAADYPSAAAASKARRTESSTGRNLLAKSSYPALSLFKYEPSLGAVVDLRNLRVTAG